ncbi:hypothetical protein MLD38_032449 [Melastoma candidum]|uniref:Uncharacterized protein n=1 Tax=Melastoma candidum TaxID=119954 RepID=A0ACB9M5N6_9MYRT|nr:hypothetical protein MLD38_032449 [Melastoma candidum]
MMALERLLHVLHGLKSPFMMVLVQVALAISNILYKLAASRGMSLKIIVAYRLVLATAFLGPIAFFYERKIRPRLTPKVLIQSFFCGLFGGSLGQGLYLESLALTSATYASAMLNLIPSVTFVLAVLFGLERLSIRRVDGKAKVIGTLLGLGGAMLLTFYKGVEIHLYTSHVNLLNVHHPGDARAQHHNMLLGSILAVGCCLSTSVWLIIQTKMSKEYPCQLSSTAMMSFMGAIQGGIYALVRERDLNQWKLHWNVGLLTVVFAGIISSGFCITLMTWCVRLRGPLFVSMFSPLMLVVLALTTPALLGEKLYLGSVIGAGLIICGLYSVLWGQGRERKRLNQIMPAEGAGSVESALEIMVTSQAKDDGNHKGSEKDSELEEGRKSSVRMDQEGGIVVPPMTPI